MLAIIIIKFHGYFTSSMFNPIVTKVFDDLKWAPIDRGVRGIGRRKMLGDRWNWGSIAIITFQVIIVFMG